MKTKTIQIYTFDELSDKAKDKAYYKWLESIDYYWHDENVNSLQAFCKVIGISDRHIDYEYGHRDYINVRYDFDDNIMALRGHRLSKFLWNNYAHDFLKGKYYSTQGKYIDGKYCYKSRYSKIQKTWQDCPLTGYCVDYNILQPFFDFIDKPLKDWDITDVLNDCFESWLKTCSKDYEHCTSMEYFANEASENDYEFLENGERA